MTAFLYQSSALILIELIFRGKVRNGLLSNNVLSIVYQDRDGTMLAIRPRLEKILALHGQALLDAVGQREHNDSLQVGAQFEVNELFADALDRDLLRRFAEADPTDGKSRTQWLVKTYIQDEQFKLEDLGRAYAALSAFERFKPKFSIRQRELSRLKSLLDLETLVAPFIKAKERIRLTRDLSSATGRELRRLEEMKARDESIIVQEEDGLPTIVVPMTKFASCWWGRGTTWCTAAEKDNAFMMYYQDAPLVIIVCPDGSKFQMYVKSYIFRFMDNTDETVDEKIILERWNEFQSLIYWAIEQNGDILQFVPSNHRTPELCRLAIEQNGKALYAVPHDPTSIYCEDYKMPELYRIAVERNGMALQYIPQNKITSELCRIAVVRNGWALQHVPAEQRTPDICRLAIEQDGWALQHVPAEQRTSEFCRLAIEEDGMALGHVPEKHRDEELCHFAIKRNGQALRYVPANYITPTLYRMAVVQNGRALYHVPEERRTSDLCRLAVEQNGLVLEFVPENKRTLKLCRIAVQQNGNTLYNVPIKHRTPELCCLAVEQNGMALRFVSENKRSLKLCRIAVEQNGYALQYIPEELKTPEFMALIPPTQPKWNVDILQGLCSSLMCHR
jgi:hypothetical protein